MKIRSILTILMVTLLLFMGKAQANVRSVESSRDCNSARMGSAHEMQIIRLVRIPISDHSEVYRLNEFRITIDCVEEDFVHAFVTDEEIATLRNAGYEIDILIESYQEYMDKMFQRGFYHTYAQVADVLDSFVTNYPDICRLDTIGYSVLNRAIWAMRVTDNPQIEENEPEIRLKGNIHGIEHIGTEITLYFLRYLLTNYATNSQVQDLINNMEIWIIPTQNPDGKVMNIRYNVNGVDLNRDHGFFWDGWGNSPAPCSQQETRVIAQHQFENSTSFEFDNHSWSSSLHYAYYPWDYHPADPPDSLYLSTIAQLFADSGGFTCTNGYDDYQLLGTSGDHMIGIGGAFSFATENPMQLDPFEIDTVCFNHRDGLMAILEQAAWGIEGVVKDSVTNEPLYARVEFINPDRIDVFTDPILGDFHKMVEEGTYTLRFSANGYSPKVVNNVTVLATGSVSVGDVLLTSDSTYFHAFRVVLCRYANHAEHLNSTRPRFTLGPSDNVFFSLGANGYIVLDMGQNSLIANEPGDDFTIYEGDDGADEGYEVFANNDWGTSWYSCGSATGTASFDLSTAGLNDARYIRIEDDGSSSIGPYGGFDLDAIEFWHVTGVSESKIVDVQPHILHLTVSPNPFHSQTEIRYSIQDAGYSMKELILRIYDVSGRLVRSFDLISSIENQESRILWRGVDDVNRKLASGVYFLNFTAGDYTTTEKLLLIR